MKSAADKLYEQASEISETHRLDLAEQYLRKALEADPRHVFSLLMLSGIFVTQGRREEAVVQAREAVRCWPTFAGAHYTLARALDASHLDEQALNHAREAIRLRPDVGRYRRVICGIHIKLDQFEDAVIEAERGLALAPDDLSLLNDRAMGLAGLGRVEEAGAVALELLRQKPNVAPIQSSAGHIFKMTREFEKAESHFRSALAIDAQLPSAHIGLGLVRYGQGRWEEAKPFLEEGIKLSNGEDDSEVQNALAAVSNREPAHPLAKRDVLAREARERYLLSIVSPQLSHDAV